jgi:hypothetical protein
MIRFLLSGIGPESLGKPVALDDKVKGGEEANLRPSGWWTERYPRLLPVSGKLELPKEYDVRSARRSMAVLPHDPFHKRKSLDIIMLIV